MLDEGEIELRDVLTDLQDRTQLTRRNILFLDDLRDREGAKIACGKAHFGALHVKEALAEYNVARSVDDVLDRASA